MAGLLRAIATLLPSITVALPSIAGVFPCAVHETLSAFAAEVGAESSPPGGSTCAGDEGSCHPSYETIPGPAVQAKSLSLLSLASVGCP